MKIATGLRAAVAAIALLTGLGSALAGDKPKGVVELFTSQGCNSCPPADAFFAELVRKGEVVALAYHVDYWDYLGWQDTLAKPENTARQYAYMKSLTNRAVFTPQMIVNGRRDVNGADKPAVEAALAQLSASGEGMTVQVDVSETDASIVIKAGATTEPAAEASLVLVFYHPPQAVDIARGENTGRATIYLNAVSKIQSAGMWHGKVTEFELPKTEFEGNGGCIALLQATGKDGGPGPILGASIVRQP